MSIDSCHAVRRPRGSAPRLLYVVTEDWAFLSHRLPMARAAWDAFEVHVATRVGAGAAAIAAEGFILNPIPFARGGSAPLTAATIFGSRPWASTRMWTKYHTGSECRAFPFSSRLVVDHKDARIANRSHFRDKLRTIEHPTRYLPIRMVLLPS